MQARHCEAAGLIGSLAHSSARRAGWEGRLAGPTPRSCRPVRKPCTLVASRCVPVQPTCTRVRSTCMAVRPTCAPLRSMCTAVRPISAPPFVRAPRGRGHSPAGSGANERRGAVRDPVVQLGDLASWPLGVYPAMGIHRLPTTDYRPTTDDRRPTTVLWGAAPNPAKGRCPLESRRGVVLRLGAGLRCETPSSSLATWRLGPLAFSPRWGSTDYRQSTTDRLPTTDYCTLGRCPKPRQRRCPLESRRGVVLRLGAWLRCETPSSSLATWRLGDLAFSPL